MGSQGAEGEEEKEKNPTACFHEYLQKVVRERKSREKRLFWRSSQGRKGESGGKDMDKALSRVEASQEEDQEGGEFRV